MTQAVICSSVIIGRNEVEGKIVSNSSLPYDVFDEQFLKKNMNDNLETR